MPPTWHELYRSVVLPAHCDHYGHMNVRQYAAFFDDAGWQILGTLGVSLTDLRTCGLGSVVASLTIDFHHELKAGQLIVASHARQYWHRGAPEAVAAPHCGQRSERESMDGVQA